MSHFTRVQTKITQREHLLGALKALGYQIEEHGRVPGWGGQSTTAEIAVRVPNGKGVGFVRRSPDAPYEIVADWMIAGVNEQTFRQQVEREYAATAAETAARAQGWTALRREQRDDGTIVITGTRH